MSMKIVITDSNAAAQDDLDYSIFSSLGEVAIYGQTTGDAELISRCREADAIIINKCVISKEVLKSLPLLRYIGITATGSNTVALDEARERGITVTNVPAYSTDAVAQMIFAHILNITNKVALHAEAVRDGEWLRTDDFCFIKAPLSELTDKTIGIFGFGEIGRKTAEIAAAFGMKVLFTTRRDLHDYRQVDFNTLLKDSDILALTVPLTAETKEIMNRDSFSRMKDRAIFINTSRGGLVDEAALYEALTSGMLQAAGLDVISKEPPKEDSPLFHLPNCFITPHIAWAPRETRARLIRIAYENLSAWTRGERKNVIA